VIFALRKKNYLESSVALVETIVASIAKFNLNNVLFVDVVHLLGSRKLELLMENN
jgi:hypothetical protein